MLSKPSLISSLATAPLTTLSRPRLVFSLLALSLYGGIAALALPRLVPRALSRLWGPLPRYDLQLRGGDLCLRCAVTPADAAPSVAAKDLDRPGPARAGSPAAPPLAPASRTAPQGPAAAIRLDAPLTIVLRPEQPVAGPVFAHAFLRRAGRTARWPLLLERSPDGTLQLRGIVREVLDLAPQELGRYELLFVIQRSPLPPDAAAARGLRPGDPAQLLRGELTVLPPVEAGRP